MTMPSKPVNVPLSAWHILSKYLAARFKAHTGLSPQAYHTRLRVSEAARLLRESGLNVTEISDRLGYCNPQYFSRTFAAVRGQSPSEYRRGLMRG